MRVSIFSKEEEEKYKTNLDELGDNIDWVTIKSLLQIEGIDKEKVLKISLNYLESIFRRKREVVMVKYVLEDNSFICNDEEINNAEEIVNLAKDFLNSNDISEEYKIVLKGVILRNFETMIRNSYYTIDTLENLMSMGIDKKEILANKEIILKNIRGINVPDFNSFCFQNNEPNDITVDELVELMFSDKENIIPKNFERLSEKQKEDYEISIYAIKKVISELLERQNLDMSAIGYLGSGAYSDTIKVGNFVVKVGLPRNNSRGVPYSKYIIRPLISYKLKMGVYLEVQNLVDAKWWEIKDDKGNIIRELTEEEIEEELFKVYASLREDGIVWKDIKKENVGRLLKRNSSNFDIEYTDRNGEKGTYEMNVSDDRLEIVGREDEETEILPAGELVIIDRDYLVGRGAWTAKNPTPKKGEEFNKRYEAMDR